MIEFKLHCTCNHCHASWQQVQEKDLQPPWQCPQCQHPIPPEISEDLNTTLQDMGLMLERLAPNIVITATIVSRRSELHDRTPQETLLASL